ncbi:hypothetical protein BGZ67_009825 [Mortierella alpina]|nr:hypothetical protein BGZ67_009825 [Mortierella alpina]
MGAMLAREYAEFNFQRDLDIEVGRLEGLWVSNEDATDVLFQAFQCLQCFRDQHLHFAVSILHRLNNHNITSSWRLGEIIVEYIALKQASLAWKDSNSNITDAIQGYENAALGLTRSDTPEKGFLLSYAKSVCEKRRIESHWDMIELKNKRTPPSWYINEALKNFQAFSDSFDCSVGTIMNPEKKMRYASGGRTMIEYIKTDKAVWKNKKPKPIDPIGAVLF